MIHMARRAERLRPYRYGRVHTSGERLFAPALAFMHMPMPTPIPAHWPTEAQGGRTVTRGERPGERGAHVVMFRLQVGEPHGHLWAKQLRFHRLDDLRIIGGMLPLRP